MKNARLMDRPEDIAKLGLKAGVVELWEDGRRADDTAGVNEVWYFDATMNDGTKLIVGFRPKTLEDMGINRSSPNINIMITTPDGTTYDDMWVYSGDEATMDKDQCNVQFGPHSAVGDLTKYDVKVCPVNGVGAELHYECLVKPFRAGGTAYVALGDNDEFYYTDMSIPKSRVTGTVTAGGKTYEVQGLGYHDHQWMNIHAFRAWHHWLWGRLYAGEYTVVIYDFIATEEFGFKRIPILGIMDGTGNVIFDNTKPVKCDIELYMQKETQKPHPKVCKYTFEDGGKKVQFNVEWINEIEVRDMYGTAPEQQRATFDQMSIQPTYLRYYAKGNLSIIEGGTTIERSGNMIYEFAYFGKPDDRAHL